MRSGRWLQEVMRAVGVVCRRGHARARCCMQEVTHAGGWLQIGATVGGDFRLTPLSAHLKVRPARLRSRPGSAEGPGPFHPRASAGPADLRPHWTEAPGPDARRASPTAGQGRSGSPRPNARAPDAAARGRGDSWGWREGHFPVPEGALCPRCWCRPSQVSPWPQEHGESGMDHRGASSRGDGASPMPRPPVRVPESSHLH